jgi:acyl-CoA thioester hydrolase
MARGYELDSYGHVNNAVFFNYFEHARWELFKDTGLMEFVHGTGLFLVVVEVNIRYQQEVRLGEEVEITTRVSREGPFIWFDQKMVHSISRKPAARARVKTVFVDHDRITHDIPSELGNLFE